MLIQLETRLEQDPNDGEGWFMLARSYQFLKRYDDAVNRNVVKNKQEDRRNEAEDIEGDVLLRFTASFCSKG